MRKDNCKRIVVAHPLQQHSYYTAQALEKKGFLYSYITTVYYKSEDYIYKMLARVLGADNVNRMKGRQNKLLNDYVVKYYEILGIIYLFFTRFDKKKLIEPTIYGILTDKFGKKVYKYCLEHKPDAIIMYDTTAYNCFKKINRSGMDTIKILDMSSSAAPYIREIILNELDSEDIFKDSLKVKLKSYTRRKCKKYIKEIEQSDYFLVASSFVEKGLIKNGVSKDKIIYVPYGVDRSRFEVCDVEKNNNKNIQFLFIGRVEAAKGIYYILEAFRQLSDLNIELTVVGSVDCDKKMLDIYQKNVKFVGVKSKEEIPKIYRDADVYIMPSLWEGFSLTLFEAMISGLPVIASQNSGAEGIITDYEQGFIIKTGSIEEIKEKILWFVKNSDKIKGMGEKAKVLSKQYTWELYYERLIRELNIRL